MCPSPTDGVGVPGVIVERSCHREHPGGGVQSEVLERASLDAVAHSGIATHVSVRSSHLHHGAA